MGALLDELRDRKVYVIVDSCHAGTMTRSPRPAGGQSPATFGPSGSGCQREGGGPWRVPRSPRSRAAARQRETGFIEMKGDLATWTAVLAASNLALEDREAQEPEGVFTRRFVRGIAEGLADRDGDGRVVHAELLDYVRSESTAYCSRHPRDCEAGLTPTLEGPRDLLIAGVAAGTPPDAPADAASETAVEAAAGGALGHANAAGGATGHQAFGARAGRRVGHLPGAKAAAPGTCCSWMSRPMGTPTVLFPNRFSEQAGEGAAVGAGARRRDTERLLRLSAGGEPAARSRPRVCGGHRGSDLARRSSGSEPGSSASRRCERLAPRARRAVASALARRRRHPRGPLVGGAGRVRDCAVKIGVGDRVSMFWSSVFEYRDETQIGTCSDDS